MQLRDRTRSSTNPLIYIHILKFRNDHSDINFTRFKKRDSKRFLINKKVYMIKTRIIIMKDGYVLRNFETKIVKPRIGETISIGEDKHYEIKFIQYMFSEEEKFRNILITAIQV